MNGHTFMFLWTVQDLDVFLLQSPLTVEGLSCREYVSVGQLLDRRYRGRPAILTPSKDIEQRQSGPDIEHFDHLEVQEHAFNQHPIKSNQEQVVQQQGHKYTHTLKIIIIIIIIKIINILMKEIK